MTENGLYEGSPPQAGNFLDYTRTIRGFNVKIASNIAIRDGFCEGK